MFAYSLDRVGWASRRYNPLAVLIADPTQRPLAFVWIMQLLSSKVIVCWQSVSHDTETRDTMSSGINRQLGMREGTTPFGVHKILKRPNTNGLDD